jgi:hypothetical protein
MKKFKIQNSKFKIFDSSLFDVWYLKFDVSLLSGAQR